MIYELNVPNKDNLFLTLYIFIYAVPVVCVGDLHLPKKAKAPGRPKGSSHTSIIGVQKKTPRKPRKKAKAFEKKTKPEKSDIVLKAIIKPDVRGTKRQYDDDDVRDIDDMTNAVLDTDLDKDMVTRRLTVSARNKVARLIRVKRDTRKYVCSYCKRVCGEGDGNGDEYGDSVQCNSCLEWMHITPCSNDSPPLPPGNWFCTSCKL